MLWNPPRSWVRLWSLLFLLFSATDKAFTSLVPLQKGASLRRRVHKPLGVLLFFTFAPPFVCTHSPTALAELLVDKRHPPRRPKCDCDRREVKNVGDGDCPPGNRQHGMFQNVFQVPTRSHSTIYAVWCPVSECCVRSYVRVWSYDWIDKLYRLSMGWVRRDWWMRCAHKMSHVDYGEWRGSKSIIIIMWVIR